MMFFPLIFNIFVNEWSIILIIFINPVLFEFILSLQLVNEPLESDQLNLIVDHLQLLSVLLFADALFWGIKFIFLLKLINFILKIRIVQRKNIVWKSLISLDFFFLDFKPLLLLYFIQFLYMFIFLRSHIIYEMLLSFLNFLFNLLYRLQRLFIFFF